MAANTGITDPINVVLQTLYMIKEVRKSVYEYKCTQQNAHLKSQDIAYQLQVLFANLQSTNRRSINIEAILNTFGYVCLCNVCVLLAGVQFS